MAVVGPAEAQASFTFRLGALVPLTGGLSSLGPDMLRAVQLAVEEANAADPDFEVVLTSADDGTSDSATAERGYEQLVGSGVTAIVGPCCSGVTRSVLDRAIEDEVVVVSPSAGYSGLTQGRNNAGFFYRTVPPEAFAGTALANLMMGEIPTSTTVYAVYDHTSALADQTTAFFAQMNTVPWGDLRTQTYVSGGSLTQPRDAVCSTPGAAVAFFGYPEDAASFFGALGQSCSAQLDLYASPDAYQATLPASAAGLRGVVAPLITSSTFHDRFYARYGAAPGLYAIEAYDAASLLILAAARGGSPAGSDLIDDLLHVSNPEGTVVTSVQQGIARLRTGVVIDYNGESQAYDLHTDGDVVTKRYQVWEFTGGEFAIKSTIFAQRTPPDLGADVVRFRSGATPTPIQASVTPSAPTVAAPTPATAIPTPSLSTSASEADVDLYSAENVYWRSSAASGNNPLLQVKPDSVVRVKVTNADGGVHNIRIGGSSAPTLDLHEEGDELIYTFTSPSSGTVEYICTIHASTMKGSFAVLSGTAAPGLNDAGATGAHSPAFLASPQTWLFAGGGLLVALLLGGVVLSRRRSARAGPSASQLAPTPSPPAAPDPGLSRREAEAAAQRAEQRRADAARQAEHARREAEAASRTRAEATRQQERAIALRARHGNLRGVDELQRWLERATGAADAAALAQATERLQRIEDGLVARERTLAEIKELDANQRQLAKRVSKGELDGRTYETLKATLDEERAELHQKLRAMDDELFHDEFEKPV